MGYTTLEKCFETSSAQEEAIANAHYKREQKLPVKATLKPLNN